MKPYHFLLAIAILLLAASSKAQLAQSAWPKFHGGVGSTGQGAGAGAIGKLLWTTGIDKATISSPSIDVDGTVFVAGGQNLYALDGQTGSIKWTFHTNGPIYSSPAVGMNKSVFFGTADGTFYALDSANGDVKWSYPIGGTIVSSATIGPDGTVYVGETGAAMCNLFAFNPATGKVKWAHPTSDVISSPTVDADGTVYFGSNDFYVYALDPSDGSTKWSFPTGGHVECAPAIGNGTVYVNADDGFIYALSVKSGSKMWSFDTKTPIGISPSIVSSPAIGPDGTVYVGSYNRTLYALGGADGVLKWSFASTRPIQSSPVVSPDGTVYLGPCDGAIYAFDGATGNQYWVCASGLDFLSASSPAIGLDGTLYVGAGSSVIAIQSVHLMSLTLDPNTVIGDDPSTGTVTLDNPAPPNGVTVMLSSNSELSTVPKSVLIPGGKRSVTFTIFDRWPNEMTTVVITTKLNGQSKAANLTIKPDAITSFTLSPDTVVGGSTTTGTVAFGRPRENGGVIFLKSSGMSNVTMPDSVMIPTGATSVSFSIMTKGVDSATKISITASDETSSASANLTINTASLVSLKLNPSLVVLGNPCKASIMLDGLTGPSGMMLTTLSSNTKVATVPTSVTIPAGQNSAMFDVMVQVGKAGSVSTISATNDKTTVQSTLTTVGVSVSGVTLSPASVFGGGTYTGTVTLTGPAPAGGVVVNIKSDQDVAPVPTSITVKAGRFSESWSETVKNGKSTVTATISAYVGSVTKDSWKTASLTVTPLSVVSESLSMLSLVGGSQQSVTATIFLNGPAPKNGFVVPLTSSNPKVATVPGSVTVKQGAHSAIFTINHLRVDSTMTVRVGPPTSGNLSQDNFPLLTLNPFQVNVFTATPTSVVTKPHFHISLNAIAGLGSKAISVRLSSNSKSVALPATTTIPIGSSSVDFDGTANPVATDQTVTFTATVGSSSQMASLKLTAPRVKSFTISPMAVTGGTQATGVLTLTGPAPATGISVKVTSNSDYAGYQGGTVIIAGKTSASFVVKTIPVPMKTMATLTASLNGDSTSAGLTVNAPQLKSFTLSVSKLVGGKSCTGTITLDGPAPKGGTPVGVVALLLPAVRPPYSVLIVEGKTSVVFTITSVKVSSTQTGTITASLGELGRIVDALTVVKL